MKKTKVLLIAVIVSIFIMITLFILLINKTNLLTNNGLINLNPESEQELFSYAIYDNQDNNNVKILATINSGNGIDYIENWDGNRIDAHGKNTIAIDYSLKMDETKTIKIKEIGKNNIQTESIEASDAKIEETALKMEKLFEVHGYRTVEIKKTSKMNGFKLYYQIGEGTSWKEGDATVSIFDYDAKEENIINNDETITITAKIENATNGNKVIISKKYDADSDIEIEGFEATSLLDGIDNYVNQTGLLKIYVNDVKYIIRAYYYDYDVVLDEDTIIGYSSDVATSSAYAQRMVVLKVNGNLTINSGKTLTAIASSSGYGGPKGMLIYCTGTLTNNGTISMTARGAKAVGEDVYLWKNTDETYEYVPATGGTGGAGRALRI